MELMRGLAFIALLFAGSAVGAELRQAEVCGDGTTHQAGFCPAVLSSASCSATGATTGSCSATSDETDGTRYVCATSNNTALTGAEIEACSGGAAIAGSSAAETGSNSIALSGLTTDAAHYGQIVNESPEGWYSNRLVTSSFTPTDPGGDPYDLTAGGTRTPPAWVTDGTFSWPTEPTTTREVTVTTASQFNSEAAVNGTKINVNSSFSGAVTITGDDIDVVMSNAATITGSLTIGSAGSTPQRIRWTGGNIANGPFDIDNVTDLLMDDVFISTNTAGVENQWNTTLSKQLYRIAIINSTLYTNSSDNNSWAVHLSSTALAGGTSTNLATHHKSVLFANVKIGNQSSGQSFRLMGCDQCIIVDSYFNPFGTSVNGHRWSWGSNQVWMADSTVRGFMLWQTNAGEAVGVSNATVSNVSRYVTGSDPGGRAFAQQAPSSTGTINNSQMYNDLLGSMSISPMTGSNPAIQAYTTPPSAASYGAQR